MGLFSKKQKTEWIEVKKYYKINGEIYKFILQECISKKDTNLSSIELFNKYGVNVCKYDLTYDMFSIWDQYYEESFDIAINQLGVPEEIDIKDLPKVVKSYKAEFKKKFEDFDLEEDKLYTQNVRVDAIGEQCFNTIVKPISKLVDVNNKGMTSLILEVDVLDGKNSLTRREFITFIDFVENYSEGCNLKILDTVDDLGSVNDYFVW